MARRPRVAPGAHPPHALTVDAWAALERHPDDPGLLLLLAALYEREGGARARACYERVIDVHRWGPEGIAAQDGLDRLTPTESSSLP